MSKKPFIRSGKKDYKIKIVKTLNDTDVGTVDWDKLLILVEKNKDKLMENSTIFHEGLHTAFRNSHFNQVIPHEVEELIVSCIEAWVFENYDIKLRSEKRVYNPT